MSEGFHGFVVSVAIVRNLQMQMHSPSEPYALLGPWHWRLDN